MRLVLERMKLSMAETWNLKYFKSLDVFWLHCDTDARKFFYMVLSSKHSTSLYVFLNKHLRLGYLLFLLTLDIECSTFYPLNNDD